MSEWQRRAELVAESRERLGDGKDLGPLEIRYDQDAPESGQVWIRASCTECVAERVMRSSGYVHDLAFLAYTLAKYGCQSPPPAACDEIAGRDV